MSCYIVGASLFYFQTEDDPEKQLNRMLEMIPKRGPDAFEIFLDCLKEDYPWVVNNFKEKEVELINFNARGNLLF
jgi:asparagine synthetase B (glutamine-hydrolysing)